MRDQDFNVIGIIRVEGKISVKDRETAEAEIESLLTSRLKNLPGVEIIEKAVTATRRIL